MRHSLAKNKRPTPTLCGKCDRQRCKEPAAPVHFHLKASPRDEKKETTRKLNIRLHGH